MNILSVLALLAAYTNAFTGIYIYYKDRKSFLHAAICAISFCFVLWPFSYAFIYNAPSPEKAMLWHKISAAGWVFFCPLATHFFLVLSEKIKKCSVCSVFIYLIPAVFLAKILFGKDTPLAAGFIRSETGWGWTYISNLRSFWCWLFIALILFYFTYALAVLYIWAKKSGQTRLIKQAKSIIILDAALISVGFVTDFIIPAIRPIIPPLFAVLSVSWGLGFLFIVRKFKLITIYDAANTDLIFSTVIDPILLLDNEGRIEKYNQATASFLKYPVNEIAGRPLYDFYQSKKFNQKNIDNLYKYKTLDRIELDFEDAEGTVLNTVASFSVAESELDGIVGVVVSIHDITESKKLTASLEQMANYDKLTGLPNRRLFFEELENILIHSGMNSSAFSLVYFDLDGFKNVNDSYGHHIGDTLLTEVVASIQSVIRTPDIFARIGGDEFVLIFHRMDMESEMDTVLTRIQQAFSKPFVIEDHICKIGISYGISQFPHDGDNPETLLKKADKRMYQMKSEHKRKNL